MIIFNYLGVFAAAAGALIGWILGMVGLGEAGTMGIGAIVAGGVDIWLRGAGGGQEIRLLAPTGGGHFFFIPVWLLSVFLVFGSIGKCAEGDDGDSASDSAMTETAATEAPAPSIATPAPAPPPTSAPPVPSPAPSQAAAEAPRPTLASPACPTLTDVQVEAGDRGVVVNGYEDGGLRLIQTLVRDFGDEWCVERVNRASSPFVVREIRVRGSAAQRGRLVRNFDLFMRRLPNRGSVGLSTPRGADHVVIRFMD